MSLVDRLFNWLFWHYGFWYHRTNWHKHPTITRFLCWMDRHDFEPCAPGIEVRRSGAWITLQCFYCGKHRNSVFPK